MSVSLTQTQEWTYAGQRLNGTKLLHAWLPDGATELLFFGKLAGLDIGGIYEVEVVVDSSDGTRVHGKPRWLRTGEARMEWLAEHAADTQIVASRQLEKNAKADNELEEALEVLRRYHGKLGQYAKRAAFLTYIQAEASRPPSSD